MKKYLLKNWWRYLLGGLSLIMSTVIDIFIPLITMRIADDVIVGKQMHLLKIYLLALAAAAIGRAVFQYSKEYLCDTAGSNVAETLRKDLMRHIFRLSKSFFDRNNTGELMARVKDDAGRVWDLFGFVGMLFIEAICYFVGVIICMVRLNWKLSLVPLSFLPFMALGVLLLERKLDKNYEAISEENASLTRVIEENISGVRTVKAFSAEDNEIKKFDLGNEKNRAVNVKQDMYMAKAEPVIQAIPKLMQVAVICIGGYAAIKGNITYGVLVAFIQYAANIVWPIENMGWILSFISGGVTGVKQIGKIFKQEPEIVDCINPAVLGKVNGCLEFKNVSFNFGGKEILKNISFSLGAGKTLGIMGATGSGKSTIINLLERFYDVTEGSISIDGNDIRELKLEQVREYSSVVMQEVFLFSDTISENVKLGSKKEMSEDVVKDALRNAQATDFVEKLTGGYEAVIGERGIGLSGGQKQRISIARALSRKTELLVLDDSTSALDMETEAEIQSVMRDKTDVSKIIIGHRVSSVKYADEIIVLDKGEIAERGTHESLIEKKGLYYATYAAQQGIAGKDADALCINAVEGGELIGY